ncbi:hypothetical protein [Dokdonia sp. Asnod2-E02]|uniref:hypothetical protein n=1 Tax=Dokdonia sp. Asnod2-E02 TaxID=3160574 RepID=UPI00386B006E
MNLRTFSLVSILFLLLGFQASAQKFKLKKGQVLVDGVAIAAYDGDNYNTVFTDLKDKSKKIIVTYTAKTFAGSETRRQWVTFKNEDASKKSDVKLEDLKFSLNFRKGLVQSMFLDFKMLTMEGLDMQAFAEFMSVDRPNLEDEYSGKNKKADALNADQVTALEKDDINIYARKGFVIVGEEKKEGVITMIFDDNAFQKSGHTVLKYNPEEEGTYLRLFSLEKGVAETKRFLGVNAESNSRFCVEVGDDMECYYGLQLKGGMAGALGAIGFNTAAFHKIIALKSGVAIVKDYETGGYAIKISSESKGYLFNTSNKDKNIEKLAKYLDCDMSKFDTADFSAESTALDVMKYYNSTCNK